LTLIELLSYRLVDCTTPDDATRRRDPDTVSNYISIAVDAAPSHAAPCMQRTPAASIRPASAARFRSAFARNTQTSPSPQRSVSREADGDWSQRVEFTR
jgi:hypothetical protein